MKRRQFITLLGGAAAGWPSAALAQQPERTRRIGVLMHTAADDTDGQTRLAAFLQGLQERGWAVGRNVRVDTRWAAANTDLFSSHAADLLALAPDVVLASTSQSAAAFQKATPPCQSCLRRSPIRLPKALSTVLLGQAVTSPDLQLCPSSA